MKKKLDGSNLIITILIFLIIWLISIIPYKLFFLDPIAKAVGDFELNDIVFSRLKNESNVDTNIVLVNIGYLNREQIANQINIINSYQPRIIGVDAIFSSRIEQYSDSLLSDALSKVDNLVLVGILEDYNQEGDFYSGYLKPDTIFSGETIWGYANLPTKFGQFSKTIRSFRPYSKVKNKIVPAFSVRVVELYSRNAYQKLVGRSEDLEVINYRGNIDKFITLDTEAFENPNIDLSFLKDKIVLLGFLGSSLTEKVLEDIYFTPLNEVYAGRSYPDMYGVAVHANIISMLINGDFIDTVPNWISSLLAFIVCYINVVYIRRIRKRLIDYYGGIAKLLIFVQSVLILIINVYLFLVFQYKMSFTLMLVGLVLIPSTVILYDNLFKHLAVLLYQKISNRKRK